MALNDGILIRTFYVSGGRDYENILSLFLEKTFSSPLTGTFEFEIDKKTF
jgi:hypothetical protein